MKVGILRHPIERMRVSSVLISTLLLLGVLPVFVVGSFGLLVAWVFSIFHPLILVGMTLVVAVWIGVGLAQGLMLCDIAIGRPELSLLRGVGGILFIFAGWGGAYFIIQDNATSHFYSPLSAWALIAIRCSVIFPLLVPFTSFVLGRARVLLFIVYFLCYPGLWWWGAIGFTDSLESVTHLNEERKERAERDEHFVREHNRVCRQKGQAIRKLDSIADAQRVYRVHGEVYIPWSISYSFMNFPGLPERDAQESVQEHRVDIVNSKCVVMELLPDCLDPPLEDGGWRQMRFTKSIRDSFDEERKGYMSAFNLEMARLVGE